MAPNVVSLPELVFDEFGILTERDEVTFDGVTC